MYLTLKIHSDINSCEKGSVVEEKTLLLDNMDLNAENKFIISNFESMKAEYNSYLKKKEISSP